MAALSEHDLYYLRSIARNLDEWHEMAAESVPGGGWQLGHEVLADNRDWLDCFIDKWERALAAEARP